MESKLTRRSFLKWTAAVGGTMALSGGVTLGLKQAQVAEAADDGVQIVPAAGTNNCGGRCLLKVHVKDGVIIRVSTDDEPEQPGAPQVRACVRGRAYRKSWLHPDRLKYPMKRVGKRGEGKFERISWDEATTIIAKEIKRTKEKYGPASRYVNYGFGYIAAILGTNLGKRLLALDGGYLEFREDYSAACTEVATPYTYGTMVTGNTQDDWLNSKLIILWGFNPAENVFGSLTMYYLRKAKEAGAKIIVVDPRYTDTAVALADQWIPLLPSTDAAVMSAMAYVMITENLHNQAFLDKYCQGFDEEHMPQGIPAGQSYKSYILGQGDGVVKTPEWAEKISRVPADTIRQLAREYAMTKPAALIQGFGPQRHANGEQVARGGTVLAALTGNIGIKGGWASGAGFAGRQAIPGVPIPENPFKGSIPVYLWTDAVVRGTEMSAKDGVKGVDLVNTGTDGAPVWSAKDGVKGVDRLPSNIKLIMSLAGNALINQHGDINKTKAILSDESKVEFIVVSDLFMTPSAKFADILLPGDTAWERNNIAPPWTYGDYVIYANKVINAPFECRNEYDWLTDVAAKLGIKDKFTEGKKDMEDWCRWIVGGIQKNHPEFPSYDEFKKRGIYKWTYKEPYIAFEKEIKDPVNNKFPTPSGKIEIFSKALYDMNDQEIPAVPKYLEAWEGPLDPLKEKYPLQLTGWHYKRRCHSIHDNNPWLEEVARQEMWMNPVDAEKRGIKDGERVKVFNDRGTVMIPVKLTPRIVPGVVAIPQGAWYTPDEKGVDQRGSLNVLTNHRATPLAKGSSQHTNLVEVAKA